MASGRQKPIDQIGQIAIGFQDGIRPQGVHLQGISETHRDGGYVGGFGGQDIGIGIADHDGTLALALGRGNAFQHMLGIGLAARGRVGPDDGRKSVRHAQRIQQFRGKIRALVGADREDGPALAQGVQSRLGARKRPAEFGDASAIMGNEALCQGIELGHGKFPANQRGPALQKRARAMPHEMAQSRRCRQSQAFFVQDGVQGADQIGRGIDQRAIEIEDDGRAAQWVLWHDAFPSRLGVL